MAMDHNIATSDNPSTSSHFKMASRIICRVCEKQFSQYTCPRCNTRYCSLHCYKSHSLRCTESFMRENVVDELRHLRPDDENRKKMLDILKRFHSEDEEDSMDEDEPNLSEEIIQKAMSGGEINYEDLNAEEKKLFHRAIASGELSKMIEPWEPWWLKPCAKTLSLSQGGARLIQTIEDNEEASSGSQPVDGDDDSIPPPGPETSLPPLSKLTTAEPSPLLAIHLVDILYCYCFTLRLYNGDWRSDATGAAIVVLSVSSILGGGEAAAQLESMLEAVSCCLEQTCSPAFRHMGGLQFGFGVVDDVITLISLGGAAILCALCDLQRLIQAALRELKSRKAKEEDKEMRKKLKFVERKIYFMMCWVHEQQEEVWCSLVALVKAEKASALECRRSIPKPEKANSKTNSSLIQEV